MTYTNGHKTDVIFTCGGTGGHLYPAIAVAQTLEKQGMSSQFLIANDREDMAHVKQYGFSAIGIGASRGTFSQYIMATYHAWKHLKNRPRLVCCTGGKITLPVAIAAFFRRIPVVILEQNIIPGRANRCIAKWAKHAFLTFAESSTYFHAHTVSGNPIRMVFPEDEAAESVLRKCTPDRPTILVVGGSQGAAKLNKLVLTAHPALDKIASNWILITGKKYVETHEKDSLTPIKLGERNIFCLPYCEAMDKLYTAATVVVARAGATTISEIMAFQKPAFFVPYPYATDNHQEANARSVCKQPGYLWCTESALTAHIVADSIQTLKTTAPEPSKTNARDTIATWIAAYTRNPR